MRLHEYIDDASYAVATNILKRYPRKIFYFLYFHLPPLIPVRLKYTKN
jgi:hypothetical protein